MNSLRFRMYLYPALLLVALGFSFQLAAQETNLVKDVMAHKGQIDWRNAPAAAIPPDVCDLLQACGKEMKVASLKPAMEGGATVKRGMFLTQTGNPKNPEAIILVHYTPNEIYYFLLGPDGNPQKTIYGQYNRPYEAIANMLGQPAFNRDKKAWQEWLTKLVAGEKKSAKS